MKQPITPDAEISLDLAIRAFERLGVNRLDVSASLSVDNRPGLDAFDQFRDVLMMAYEEGRASRLTEADVTLGINQSEPTGNIKMHILKGRPRVPGAFQMVSDAIAETLGNAMDCTRVWSAWQVGTMSQDDFVPVCADSDRLDEITTAAMTAIDASYATASPEYQCEQFLAAIRDVAESGWQITYHPATESEHSLGRSDALWKMERVAPPFKFNDNHVWVVKTPQAVVLKAAELGYPIMGV